MRKELGAIIIIGVVAVSLYIILLLESPSLDWGVEVGDEFQFDVKVLGCYDSYPGDPLGPVPFVRYNNTRITATVNFLPSCQGDISAEQFIGLINELKVECKFINGTEILSNATEGLYITYTQASICRIVSRAILPVGIWDRIDSFFPSEPENPWSCDTFLSQKLESSMYLGHRSANIDAGWGWSTNVNLTSGIPMTVTHWEQSFAPGYIWLDYRVVISIA